MYKAYLGLHLRGPKEIRVPAEPALRSSFCALIPRHLTLIACLPANIHDRIEIDNNEPLFVSPELLESALQSINGNTRVEYFESTTKSIVNPLAGRSALVFSDLLELLAQPEFPYLRASLGIGERMPNELVITFQVGKSRSSAEYLEFNLVIPNITIIDFCHD